MEEWKPIQDYPDYLISSTGRVWSGISKKILKPANYHDYLHVCLCSGGLKRWKRIHRLVAEAFIDNPNQKPTVNHINENKADNRVENLEWATFTEQNLHGTRPDRVRKKTKRKAVVQIEPGSSVAHKYGSIEEAVKAVGVDRRNLMKCLEGRRKSCGGYRWQYA